VEQSEKYAGGEREEGKRREDEATIGEKVERTAARE